MDHPKDHSLFGLGLPGIHQIVKLSALELGSPKIGSSKRTQEFREQKTQTTELVGGFSPTYLETYAQIKLENFSPNKFRGFEQKKCLRPPPTSELLESCLG